jgi:predicted HAD superfamily phosphohydrolase YqeG
MLILHKKQNGTNMERVAHALSLPFNPKLTRALMNLDSFTDLPIDKVKRYVKGLLINIDNTLAEPGAQEFPPEIMAKIDEIQRAFRVCFYTNDDDYRPELEKTGIQFARNIAAKPDPDGFKMAARLRLDLSPEECAMVGSDYTLDGASRKAGMKYIHVKPIPGPKEPFTEKLVRGYGNFVARIHDKFRQK